MRGIPDEIIKSNRKAIIEFAEKEIGQPLDLIDSFFEGFDGNAVAFLGKSIQKLSEVDVAIFGKGWQDARGCKIEHEIAIAYGIKVLYSEV
jgi:hypothetical protein